MSDTFQVRLVRIRIKTDWFPKITDHALLRYIERVDGVNIEAARQRMQSDGLRRAIVVGAGSHTIPQGKMIIKDGRVVTFLTPQMRVKNETRIANKEAHQRGKGARTNPSGLSAKQLRIIEQMKVIAP